MNVNVNVFYRHETAKTSGHSDWKEVFTRNSVSVQEEKDDGRPSH